MKPRIAVGIVGAGKIVEEVHLPVLASMPDVAVVWLTDTDKKKASAVGKAFSVPLAPPIYSEDDHLPAADVVLLGIPYGARAKYYSVLRNQEVALYVEKPFARTVAEHQTICSWFPEFGLGCGFQRRSYGPVQLLRRITDANIFGRLLEMRFSLGRRGRISSGTHHANLSQTGGGLLFDVGIHGLDTMLYVSRAKEVAKTGATLIHDHGLDIHVRADLLITTRDHGVVRGNVVVTCLEDTNEELECIYENARASTSLFSGAGVRIQGRDSMPSPLFLTCDETSPRTAYQTFYCHWRRFLDGLSSRRPNRTAAANSLLTTKAIDLIYGASSETGSIR